MIVAADEHDVRIALDRRRERERAWKNGRGAYPLTNCHRHELCQARPVGFSVPMELVVTIKRIDPAFEIIYDKWTAPGGPAADRPAFHLYSITARGVTPGMDRLHLEVSIQQNLRDHNENCLWPLGGPCRPGMWLFHNLLKSYTGPLDGEFSALRERLIRREREKWLAEERAERKQEWALQKAFVDEVAPYLDSARTPIGRNRTMQKTGFGAVGRQITTPRTSVLVA